MVARRQSIRRNTLVVARQCVDHCAERVKSAVQKELLRRVSAELTLAIERQQQWVEAQRRAREKKSAPSSDQEEQTNE